LQARKQFAAEIGLFVHRRSQIVADVRVEKKTGSPTGLARLADDNRDAAPGSTCALGS
jgi:hypothetical protein